VDLFCNWFNWTNLHRIGKVKSLQERWKWSQVGTDGWHSDWQEESVRTPIGRSSCWDRWQAQIQAWTGKSCSPSGSNEESAPSLTNDARREFAAHKLIHGRDDAHNREGRVCGTWTRFSIVCIIPSMTKSVEPGLTFGITSHQASNRGSYSSQSRITHRCRQIDIEGTRETDIEIACVCDWSLSSSHTYWKTRTLVFFHME